MVGRALLGLRDHGRLGPGPPAVHPRPLRRPTTTGLGTDRAPACSASSSAVFLLALVRHTASLGYLSGRHTLPLVLISVPWAAAGTFVCLRGLGAEAPLEPPRAPGPTGIVAASVIVATLRGLPATARPPEPLGPLGRRAAGSPSTAGPRTSCSTPAAGRVRLGRAGIRLLARPPGADRLAPRLRRRRPRGAGGRQPPGARRSARSWRTRPRRSRSSRRGRPSETSACGSTGSAGPARGRA